MNFFDKTFIFLYKAIHIYNEMVNPQIIHIQKEIYDR